MQRTPSGSAVITIHYSADPNLSVEFLRKIAAESSEADWLLEMEGYAAAKDGQLVYPEFNTAIHVVKHEEVPPMLCRFMSIDPHQRTPHAMLWVGIDKEGDWWVYRELWPAENYAQHRNLSDADRQPVYTVMQYVQLLAEIEGNGIEWKALGTENEHGIYRESLARPERILGRYMDQAGKGFLATGENETAESQAARYRRFGIVCFDPNKKHKNGEDAVRELLKTRPHHTRGQWPRLHISERCRELIYELKHYRYKTTAQHRLDVQELKQGGVGVRCHMIDNLRYLATGNLYYSGNLTSPEAPTIFGKT